MENPNFIMISRQLFDDYASGQLTAEELVIILHLFYKANIVSGRAGVNYQSVANDLEDLFKNYKNPVNQVNKVMLSLLKKCRIWFEKHSGSRSKFEVWIDRYPCKRDGS
ncbi:MAG: hypothetical protein CL944_01880 [Candidatus Diapherotrites archaeon]|uniref:Uncharacterized protein n=1 Tax=Candidatus Iainarchaeum sp. TaxID=3101447 RepID=A0A2D6LPU0_9ARCH|nr:hypothetical protein [Candidatus Diapherotrites archaeon]